MNEDEMEWGNEKENIDIHKGREGLKEDVRREKINEEGKYGIKKENKKRNGDRVKELKI